VVWDQAIVSSGNAVKAVVVNSGNANACTGEQGDRDVESMAMKVADTLLSDRKEVLVCSTGVIGVPLPMDRVLNGIESCMENLAATAEAAAESAEAILTTDTFVKSLAVEIEIGGIPVRIGGMAKGSGMIHPNMATMLSFITTDAAVEQSHLQTLLGATVVDSYNMISVDGDTSTNDTVLVLANGTSGAAISDSESEEGRLFSEAFLHVHTELAKMIVMDGEGAGKFIEVQVKGAPTKNDARLMARIFRLGCELGQNALCNGIQWCQVRSGKCLDHLCE
jgi:glutamate N-acetyltransferase/amino-acid N-acetyltransferase